MKNIWAALLGIVVMGVTINNAFASGTPAGTVVSSRSRVIYTTASGANSDTLYSNSVSFTVAQIAAVNRTPVTNSATTTSDSVNVDYAMSIINSGNGTDHFNLAMNSTKGWTVTCYYDANGDGILEPQRSFRRSHHRDPVAYRRFDVQDHGENFCAAQCSAERVDRHYYGYGYIGIRQYEVNEQQIFHDGKYCKLQ